MNQKCDYIGVFDSGLGGLTVWREIIRLLPDESVVYYGDGKNCPYGNRERQEVIGFVEGAVKFFIAKGCKIIVLACNAATACAIDYLRTTYPEMLFVGMEPAVKPAALHSKSGVIGILATAATLNGKLFKETSERFSSKVEIISRVGEGFVELVEADMEDSDQAYQIVKQAVDPMIEQGVDHIVLGCTHYPFLENTMKKIIGNRDVTIVDPAPAVAQRVKSLLDENQIRCSENHVPKYEFFTSADDQYQRKIIQKSKL